jgi:hypothetical protein
MTTPAQIAANRRNARHSTGPATDAGKEVASGNALSHGLTARQLLCADERSQEFLEFAEALRRDLAPAGAVEEQLAERIILTAWRLRRAARAERAVIDSWHLATQPHHLLHGETGLSRMFRKMPDNMTALSRYEAALDRALGRAYAMLERRQARRRGEHVPAPVTVLVEGVGETANPLARNPKFENYETNPIDVTPAGEALEAPRAEGE